MSLKSIVPLCSVIVIAVKWKQLGLAVDVSHACDGWTFDWNFLLDRCLHRMLSNTRFKFAAVARGIENVMLVPKNVLN